MKLRYCCSCGLTAEQTVRGDKAPNPNVIQTVINLHANMGHHEVTAKQAAAIRRKQNQEETK